MDTPELEAKLAAIEDKITLGPIINDFQLIGTLGKLDQPW
jgi:hypothetical protein